MPAIHFATPCYGGQINEVCFQSYLQWTILAMQNDLAFTVDTLSNESNINRGRNSCAAKFLKGDCTHLMFVDADIGWNPVDVVKLVNHERDVVVGAYPQKTMPAKYVVNVTHDGEHAGDLVEVDSAGTGFMLIRRNVFERLIEEGATKYSDDIGLDAVTNANQYDFFNCTVETGQYLTEDYSFCHSIRRAGFKIWLDKTINLTHTGYWRFPGDTNLLKDL